MTNVSFLINLFLSFPFAFFSFQIDWFLLWNMHYNWILEIYSSDKCYLLIMFIFALTFSVIQGYICKPKIQPHLHPFLQESWKKTIAMTRSSNDKCWYLLGFTQSFDAWLLKACVTSAWSFFYFLLEKGAVILSFILKEKIFYRLFSKALLK